MQRHIINRLRCAAAVLSISSAAVFGMDCADASGATEQYGTGSSLMLGIYQRFVSPLKGGNTCPMHPSCSQYAQIAFERTDPFSALIAISDRFVNCGRDVSSLPRIATADGVRFSDPPVEERDTKGVTRFVEVAELPVANRPDSGCAAFAWLLKSQKNFLLAALEFERVVQSSPELACRKSALLGILECSYRSDNLDRFTDQFYRITGMFPADTLVGSKCGLLLAKRYYDAGEFGEAYKALCFYCTATERDLRAERYFLQTLCQLNLRHGDLAGAVADSIPAESVLAALADSLRGGTGRFYANEKSPFLAGCLSALVPGAGYLYAGKPATASASLLINGLFAWTAAEFISGRHYGAAATSLLLGSGFYFGNISGSVKAVDRSNKKATRRKCALVIDAIHYSW